MSNFQSVESAYQALADSCYDFIHGRAWSVAVCQAQILRGMAKISHLLMFEEKKNMDGLDWPDSSIDPGGAALFLRDDLLRTTGQRIWGLTFTLYPTGKFNIEYDYKKPEGYEETDEIITGDEINASLGQLTGQDKKPG